MARMNLSVNGRRVQVDVEPETPLLYVLRNDLELNGPRFGCGLGQCGNCTVIIDGKAVRSCVTPMSTVGERAVTTQEGLGTIEKPHPLQQAFIDEQALGCGYCTNGMIMTAKAALDANPKATETEVIKAMDNTLCRCAAHIRILKAIRRYQNGLGTA
jgi:nicotinate dehydrogenase subunit A